MTRNSPSGLRNARTWWRTLRDTDLVDTQTRNVILIVCVYMLIAFILFLFGVALVTITLFGGS